MIVSDRHNFVFIHNPKVAGSSIRKALLPYNDSSIELWHQRFIPELQRVVDMSHLSAAEFATLTDACCFYAPSDAFYFGFVRDPYARFVSALREYSKQNNVDVWSSPEKILEFVDRHLSHANIMYEWSLSHFRPQYTFFYKGGKRIADFIGRFDYLQEDLNRVWAYLNLGFPPKLGHERDTGHPMRLEDPELTFGPALERINRLYARDWLLLGPELGDSKMVGKLPHGLHVENVENVRTPEGRWTYYGEPPGLALGEKVAFLTAENERLRRLIQDHDPDLNGRTDYVPT